MLNIQTCYKSLLVTTFCTAILAPNISSAASIANGDFSTGDFTGWSQDTDGWGTPISGLNDFSIVPGNNAARIEIDYWSTAGDPLDEAWFSNTLYQAADLTAGASHDLVLSFDWEFGGETSPGDENFLVAFGDGTGDYFGADGGLGFLINTLNYGAGTYTSQLDASYLNLASMTLEFQLNSGVDGFGSYINIDNVSIEAIPQASINSVPEPTSLFLIISGIIGLVSFQRKMI